MTPKPLSPLAKDVEFYKQNPSEALELASQKIAKVLEAVKRIKRTGIDGSLLPLLTDNRERNIFGNRIYPGLNTLCEIVGHERVGVTPAQLSEWNKMARTAYGNSWKRRPEGGGHPTL